MIRALPEIGRFAQKRELAFREIEHRLACAERDERFRPVGGKAPGGERTGARIKAFRIVDERSRAVHESVRPFARVGERNAGFALAGEYALAVRQAVSAVPGVGSGRLAAFDGDNAALVRHNAVPGDLAAAPAAVPDKLLTGGVRAAEKPFALGPGAFKRAGICAGKAAPAVQDLPRQIGRLTAYRRAAGKLAGEQRA